MTFPFLKIGVVAKLRAKEQKSVLKLKRISPILDSESQNKEKSDERD